MQLRTQYNVKYKETVLIPAPACFGQSWISAGQKPIQPYRGLLYFPGPTDSSPENGQEFSKYGGAYVNTVSLLYFVTFSFCYRKYLKWYVIKMNYKIH